MTACPAPGSFLPGPRSAPPRFGLGSGPGQWYRTGTGRWQGGDGIRRDLELLCHAQVTILSERRVFAPYGLAGGEAGEKGKNVLLHHDQELELAGKVTLAAQAGDILSLRTPGGGGYGLAETRVVTPET